MERMRTKTSIDPLLGNPIKLDQTKMKLLHILRIPGTIIRARLFMVTTKEKIATRGRKFSTEIY